MKNGNWPNAKSSTAYQISFCQFNSIFLSKVYIGQQIYMHLPEINIKIVVRKSRILKMTDIIKYTCNNKDVKLFN